MEVTALYSFEGQQPGDLNFQAGDRITVISKTDSHFGWWEGKAWRSNWHFSSQLCYHELKFI